MEKLSTVQYARKAGKTKQAILYRINNNIDLPGVSKVELIAGRHILFTDLKKLDRDSKKSFRKE
jgi:hypothetical protein